MARESIRINFFDTEAKEIKNMTKTMLKTLLEHISTSDFMELEEMYKDCKYIRYVAKDYLDESLVSGAEKDILTNIGYTNALLDMMQLYTEQKLEQFEIQRINTKYKYSILKVLAEKGTVLHKDLALLIGVSASGLTAVIQRMNATSVRMINIEEVSKYKLYSLTAQAYRYYIQNERTEPDEVARQDNQKYVILDENSEKEFVERKIIRENNWQDELKTEWESLRRRRKEKYLENNFDLQCMENCQRRKKPA